MGKLSRAARRKKYRYLRELIVLDGEVHGWGDEHVEMMFIVRSMEKMREDPPDWLDLRRRRVVAPIPF